MPTVECHRLKQHTLDFFEGLSEILRLHAITNFFQTADCLNILKRPVRIVESYVAKFIRQKLCHLLS